MEEPKNPIKDQIVETDNSLKEMFVQYVGEKMNPPNGEVTVDMIVSVLADEFPEFVLVVAEENFIQGYKQAFVDMESWKQTEQKAFEKSNSDLVESADE